MKLSYMTSGVFFSLSKTTPSFVRGPYGQFGQSDRLLVPTGAMSLGDKIST